MRTAETPEDGACCAGDEVYGTGVVAGYEIIAGWNCVKGVDVARVWGQWSCMRLCMRCWMYI